MEGIKDHLLRVIEDRAWREVEHLAGEFARNPDADREAILAGIRFERRLADESGVDALRVEPQTVSTTR